MCHVERTIRLHASDGSGKHFCLQTQQEGIQDTRADTVPVLHEHTSSCGSNSGRLPLPSQVVDNDHAITPHPTGRGGAVPLGKAVRLFMRDSLGVSLPFLSAASFRLRRTVVGPGTQADR